jgi:cobalt-zinc-cadmium efflux system outer membrane protein
MKIFFLVTAVVLAASGVLIAQAPAHRHAPQTQPAEEAKQTGSLRLEDLERTALQNNPTLKQAEARIRAAQGKMKQAGLYPNPIIGYEGDEISTGPVVRGGEHGFFLEQTIPLGAKLRKNTDVFREEVRQSEAEAEAQRLRVLNTLRVLFYEALAAQRRLEVRQKLAALADEAVETSKGLYNVGASDKPDLLEVEIEAQRAHLAVATAQNEQVRIRQQLGALAGTPKLPPAPLVGDFEEPLPALDPESTLDEILRASPELKLAHAGAGRARAAVTQARSRRVPDLRVRGGLRNNRELIEVGGQPVGLEGFAEVGITLPIFNRNQGDVLAARAEAEYAEQEVRREEMLIRTRFSQWFDRYQSSRRIVETYKKEVIPRAEEAYQLYLAKFQEMAAAYPQVLIAQRAALQAGVEYIGALENFWRAVIPLRGYLLMDGLDARSFEERLQGMRDEESQGR